MSVLAFCIEGTKGAGKTTTIQKLTDRLRQEGYEVEICAPFALANDYAETLGFDGAKQMISASKENNQAEIDFIRAKMAAAYEQARQKTETSTKPVVLIYDRGWMTLLPHLYGGRWYAENPAEHAAIDKIWQDILATAPATIFLHASFDITRQRRPDPDLKGGIDSEEKLRQDVEGRTAFAEKHADKIALSFNTGVIPQDEVVDRIAAYVRASTAPYPHP